MRLSMKASNAGADKASNGLLVRGSWCFLRVVVVVVEAGRVSEVLRGGGGEAAAVVVDMACSWATSGARLE